MQRRAAPAGTVVEQVFQPARELFKARHRRLRRVVALNVPAPSAVESEAYR